MRTLLLLVPEFECFRTNPAVMQRDLAGIQNSQNPQPFCAIAHGSNPRYHGVEENLAFHAQWFPLF